MQRVSALLPSWERTKSADGKARPFDRVFGWTDKITAAKGSGAANRSTSKVEREVYWPTTVDKECEKAARILKSFCTDGFLAQEEAAASAPTSPSTPSFASSPNNALKKIPPRIIQNAQGLAIFSCMRSGLWMSGSGGSGILIARKADGTWSPPAGILLHTAALGFVIGVDIYDCVLVINSVSTLEMFTRPKVTLGSDVNLSVGPITSSGLLENDFRWKEISNTVLTYLKARGQHQSVQLDGSLVTLRGNENDKFYGGQNVDVLDIIAGNVRKSIPEIAPLFEAIKAAEGRTDFDARTMEILSQQPAPGDAVIETPTQTPMSAKFGVPSSDDPDPFGVIALEMAGLEIREAGSRLRPASAQFEYNPAPTSPLFNKFNRQSSDTYATRSNRGSYMSTRTTMTDAQTQTDVAETPDTTLSPNQSDDGQPRSSQEHTVVIQEPEEVDYTKVDMSSLQKHLSPPETPKETEFKLEPAPVRTRPPPLPPRRQPAPVIEDVHPIEPEVAAPEATEEVHEVEKVEVEAEAEAEEEQDEDADDEDEDDDEEEPVIYEVATSQPMHATIMSSQVTQVLQVKGAVVNIPKRIPPPLPARSPARSSRASKSEYGDLSAIAMVSSPLRQSFQSTTSDGAASAKDDASQTTPSLGSTETEDKAGASAPQQDKAAEPSVSSSGATTDFESATEGKESADAIPETLSTPQATERASSVDESEHEPRTPKAEDDAKEASSGDSKTENSVSEKVNHSSVDTATVTVA
ncbi:uncharacterized protein E0L32_010051 [Thyridium curvatum]|uniref:Ysc84 actin-binding domain-containing protein n=1 Tax=Thyridium curvatum TaxID=1093900 RepID=A0A507APL7_9PEZI|nr:uncharacterized protein E0L32_010051 [Thyridium curvatum]TPX08434.1 hypothetical protein E0L32_010051 [Thyridium curvatum]